jgi:hypothetical protein
MLSSQGLFANIYTRAGLDDGNILAMTRYSIYTGLVARAADWRPGELQQAACLAGNA